MFHIDPTVSFSQSTYRVGEDDGVIQPQVVLSNPSSTDITLQVTDTGISATGECNDNVLLIMSKPSWIFFG